MHACAHAHDARTSGEQGATTLALASTDVRYMPLPPAFNARPYTMFNWIGPFGFPMYHGKELWKREGLEGAAGGEVTPEEAIRQRMVRDWGKAHELVKKHFVARGGGGKKAG